MRAVSHSCSSIVGPDGHFSLPRCHAASSPRRDPVAPSGKGRLIYKAQNTSCPECGCTQFEMRTYGGPWEYADTYCAQCERLIRRFDAA